MTDRLAKKTTAGVATTVATWLAVPALFALTAYSIWLDRAASAAVSGAFTIAFIILPQMKLFESFKIFSLEAKFAKRVDEAEQLLANIRTTAQVHSSLLYWQLGKGDRMTSMSWDMKRDMIDKFDHLLTDLGLGKDEIKQLKTPYMHTLMLDLFRVLEHAVRGRIRVARKAVQSQMEAVPQPITPADQPRYSQLVQDYGRLAPPFSTSEDVMDDGRLLDMAKITRELLDGTPLSNEDKALLEKIRDEVVNFAEACEAQQNITPEALTYLDRYGHSTEARSQELFGAAS